MLARLMNDFAPLARLQGQMNGLLENFFDDAPQAREFAQGYPSLNFWEDGDIAYVEAELPGIAMDQIEVYVNGDELTLAGQRSIEQSDEPRFQRRERPAGRFSRGVKLPWEIDADRVEAKLVNGVLTIALPKCESCKPRKIEVKALSA
jgi:HSP20 family protein